MSPEVATSTVRTPLPGGWSRRTQAARKRAPWSLKAAALENGALGASISGGGPSVFAWCTHERGEQIAGAMEQAFRAAGLASDVWISPVAAPGARLVP